jgi:hypothetical protein
MDARSGPPGTQRLRAEMTGIKRKLVGWVARTRPLAEPLSPRGPQPIGLQIEGSLRLNQWSDGPNIPVRGS